MFQYKQQDRNRMTDMGFTLCGQAWWWYESLCYCSANIHLGLAMWLDLASWGRDASHLLDFGPEHVTWFSQWGVLVDMTQAEAYNVLTWFRFLCFCRLPERTQLWLVHWPWGTEKSWIQLVGWAKAWISRTQVTHNIWSRKKCLLVRCCGALGSLLHYCALLWQ